MGDNLCFLDSHGYKVSAMLSRPPVSNLSAIIMCHGLDSGKDSATNLALEKIFLKNNIATFRFDFFAHGESEGKIEERSLNKFVDDVLKAVDYLKSQGYKCIGICGTSIGGVAAVIAASKTPDLKVMALKAAGMGQTSRKLPNFKNDFDAKKWITAGTKITIPTLIIHGTADKDVELLLAKELAKAIKNSRIELFEDAGHIFTKKEDFERAIKDMSEFIIKNILKDECRAN